MPQRHFGMRKKSTIELHDLPRDLDAARAAFRRGEHLAAIDIYEQLLAAYPPQGVPILAELYDRYQELPQRDRYHLYQSRHFDFGILPGDKVLDIGSGHIPFPLATHLSDISLKDHGVGRGGAPFRHVDGKPVFECPVEEMPFADQEFDFVYCSHVLEHTRDPERACRELMRVAKRGYIETPSRAKDVFLASARTSHHTRGVELQDGRLIFSDYGEKELEGIGCEILQSMHSSPQSDREKAFAALIWLKADVVNTMLLWEGSFEFESRQSKATKTVAAGNGPTPEPETGRKLTFLQVHTFYPSYLDDFYRKNPELERQGFTEQMNALVRDGFSGIHMFAPYMRELGYEPHFVVANNPKTQAMWLHEQGIDYQDSGDWLHDVARLQVEAIRPDVLYLSDPINFDAGFLRTLSYRPKVVLGWRAANISAGTDWSGFDVMLSSLSSLRAVSLTLGARSAEHFFPGFPSWVNLAAPDREPLYDVVFSGSWTATQHPRRNEYLVQLARAASKPGGFSLALYLNAAPQALPPEVQRYNKGGRFGVAMHEALKTGRIVVDARGVLEYTDPQSGRVIDLAGPETANMRIFEATGSGCFLLAEAYQNLDAYFEPGVELETFRDEEELLKKIRYYLDHPAEREEIARRGKERCLAQYSMEQRAEKLSQLIHKAMGAEAVQDRAESAQDNPLQGVAALKEQAAGLLAEKRVAEAFDVLIRAKALKSPLEGLDLLRAHCFIAMGQFMAAKQSLLEELRFFPENREARVMLERFEAAEGDAAPQNEFEPEFKQLLAVIRPYSMLGELRLYSLFQLAKYVCQNDIPGNFVECGVAAGGSSALLAYTIKTYSKRPRTLYSFDSFSGMPTPGEHDVEVGRGVGAEESGWGTGTCAAPVDSLMEVARKLGVVSVVKPVKGYYEDTLPKVHGLVGDVAFIHIDSDWYESTRTILENFYDQIHPQALIQFDDYGYWKGCGKALHEFEQERGISFSINDIDGCGVWFRKA